MWKTFPAAFITNLLNRKPAPRPSRKRAHRLQLPLQQWTAEQKSRTRRKFKRRLCWRAKSTVMRWKVHWLTKWVTLKKMTSVMKCCPNWWGALHVCLFQSTPKSVDTVLKSFAKLVLRATTAQWQSKEMEWSAFSAKVRIRKLSGTFNQKSCKISLTK